MILQVFGHAGEFSTASLSPLAQMSELGKVRAWELGVRGVPYFLFNCQHSVSGAQPPDVFARVLASAEEG